MKETKFVDKASILTIEKNITTNKQHKFNVTIIESFRFVTSLGQCFALLPVEGMNSKNPTKVRFKWLSWKMLFTFMALSVVMFAVSVGFMQWFHKTRMEHLVEHIFYIIAGTRIILFTRLAYHWPSLMSNWCKVDIEMEKNYGYPQGLDTRLRVMTFVVLILATVEYDLSIAFHITSCKETYGYVNSSTYYQSVYPQIFRYVPYSFITAALVQIVSVLSTFIWNYNDLFIMLISSALAMRFKQVSARLKQFEKKANPKTFWIEIHEDYDRLSNLCRHLDRTLSLILLQSFATNLFYILIQLYNSLRTINDSIEKIYFYYSFVFLIFRTIAVSLYAAWINDESKEPTAILNSVPSSSYNNEIRRFLLQISFDNVALTGNKMFKVTRGLILNIAGAIVTYELVLIQFNGNPRN